MKKFYLPILVFALTVALTACGNEKKKSKSESSDSFLSYRNLQRYLLF